MPCLFDLACFFLSSFSSLINNTYHRKESLRIVRKMCRYMTKEWLSELCEEVPADPQRASFSASISEVLAVVLENEVSAELLDRSLT